jgi:hypothetical protein
MAIYRVKLERLRLLKREVAADILEAQMSGDSETEASLKPRLNELADAQKALYPPVSPYFHDTRTGRLPTGGTRS